MRIRPLASDRPLIYLAEAQVNSQSTVSSEMCQSQSDWLSLSNLMVLGDFPYCVQFELITHRAANARPAVAERRRIETHCPVATSYDDGLWCGGRAGDGVHMILIALLTKILPIDALR